MTLVRQRKEKLLNIFQANMAYSGSNMYFSRIPGGPKKLKWPVRLCKEAGDPDIVTTVYSRADNA